MNCTEVPISICNYSPSIPCAIESIIINSMNLDAYAGAIKTTFLHTIICKSPD